jgi:lysozyme family protein
MFGALMLTDIISSLIDREGGFTNHPNDLGGPTNYGITQATLQWWLKRPVTLNDIKAITPTLASEIYTALYVKNPGFDQLDVPEYLQSQLIDFGVNSGPRLVVMKLQGLLGVTQDGDIGPETKAALLKSEPRALNNRLAIERLKMVGRIISRDKSQAVFAAGWINRACSFYQP